MSNDQEGFCEEEQNNSRKRREPDNNEEKSKKGSFWKTAAIAGGGLLGLKYLLNKKEPGEKKKFVDRYPIISRVVLGIMIYKMATCDYQTVKEDVIKGLQEAKRTKVEMKINSLDYQIKKHSKELGKINNQVTKNSQELKGVKIDEKNLLKKIEETYQESKKKNESLSDKLTTMKNQIIGLERKVDDNFEKLVNYTAEMKGSITYNENKKRQIIISPERKNKSYNNRVSHNTIIKDREPKNNYRPEDNNHYIVRKGDTLWNIVKNHYDKVNLTICKAVGKINNLEDINRLEVGDELLLPDIIKVGAKIEYEIEVKSRKAYDRTFRNLNKNQREVVVNKRIRNNYFRR